VRLARFTGNPGTMNATSRWIYSGLLFLVSQAASWSASPQHFIFFDRERERISEPAFLETKAIAGAQLKYTWRELEPKKDQYDFSALRHDLAFLRSNSAPGGLQLYGWTAIDPQNHRTTVRLSNVRFNVAVPDGAFSYAEPKKRH